MEMKLFSTNQQENLFNRGLRIKSNAMEVFVFMSSLGGAIFSQIPLQQLHLNATFFSLSNFILAKKTSLGTFLDLQHETQTVECLEKNEIIRFELLLIFLRRT